VRDSAAMLDATHGPETASMFRVAPPERPYLEEVGRAPGRLRIGYTARSPIGTAVHPEAVKAVEDTARLLESLGHHVEPAEPQLDAAQLAKDFLLMWFANCAVTVDENKRRTGRGNDGFEDDTVIMAAFGRALRADEYVAGYLRWNDYTRALGQFHEKYDLFMTPTLACAPAKIGEIVTPGWQKIGGKIVAALGLSRLLIASGMVEDMARENLKYVPFTQIGNLTGVPGMSVPLHWTVDGLPIGTQFLAAPNGEGLLLRLASQLEQAKPWAGKRPVVA
jgi:amidase